MAKKAKEYSCPYCKNTVYANEAIKKGTRYYHSECIENKRIEEEEKSTAASHYKELIAYICELYATDAPTGMILKQIKDYQEQYNYKTKGMELALRYFYETLDNKVREGDGIGIIPYVYEDAKYHYLKQQKIAESINNRIDEEIVVFIDPHDNKRRSKKIDISAI